MFLSPAQVVSQFPVVSGARVADFGSGMGEHSLLLSERIGEDGTVYAFDLSHAALDRLNQERVRRGAANLFTLHADLNQHIPLSDGLLTTALVSNTLYALKDRERFLEELRRVLAPRAATLVVDWAASFKNMGPSAEEVVSPAEAVRLFRSHGFVPGGMLPAGTHHYAFIATTQ